MDTLRIVAEARGVFLTSDAHNLGYDEKSIAAALRARLWVRVRRGAYTFRDIWDPSSREEKHRILSRAVLLSLGDAVALSHTSAALEHGCATWGVDLSRVHVTRLDGGAGRTEKDVVHHEGFCLDGDVVEANGLMVMCPARAVVETATLATVESGLVTADSALHLGLVTTEELTTTFQLMARWPHTQKVRLVMKLADGRSESVGESRSRHLCWAHGLPAPELQFHVYDARGDLTGITDFAWREHHLLGEFDGKVKYTRFLRPGEKPEDAVFREKRREDLLREITRWGMIRIIWVDLYHSAETASRIRRLMTQAA